MRTSLLYIVTALAEIFGCYAIFLWLRLHKPVGWVLAGATSLALFAWLLTLHPATNAGRIYAAYGGVYIAASLLWLWAVPDRWDYIGSTLCLAGAAVIYLGPRG